LIFGLILRDAGCAGTSWDEGADAA
jgi:hypothetical protein